MKPYELINQLVQREGGEGPVARAMGDEKFQGTLWKFCHGQTKNPVRGTAEKIAKHFRLPVDVVYSEKAAGEWAAANPSRVDPLFSGAEQASSSTASLLSERITILTDASQWSEERVAEVADVSTSKIQKWLNGLETTISLAEATRLADKSGFNAVWIATGKGVQRPVVPPGDDILEPEFAGRPRTYRQIPIIGTAKLGSDGFYEELSPFEGGGDGFIEMATQDPQAYGLRVRGQSMFPAIRDGWFVLIEPNGQLRSGEYVLIKLKDGRRMVKELLVNRTSSIEVMSVNGGERMTFDFPEIESTHAVAAVVSPSKWHPVQLGQSGE